jgi:predicted DNA-binding transcriptional regulator AlpA
MRILSKREVASRCGGPHPHTLVRWSLDPRYRHLGFPRPVQISDGRIGWVEEELDAWLKTRPRKGQLQEAS